MFSSRQGFIFAGSPSTPSIVTDSLWVHLDAGNASSYSGSGTDWFDLSGNSRDSTLTNGPSYSSSDGGILTFDGTDDYATLPTMASYTDFTIEAFYKTATIGASQYPVFGSPVSTAIGPRMEIQGSSFGNHRKLRFLNGNGTDWYFTEVYSDDIFTDDTWFHMACTWAGTGDKNARIYVNGSEETATFVDTTGATPTDAEPRIMSISGNFNTGSLAILRFYNKALTSSEITQNFNAQKSRFGL
jgi:hypothetical protein